MRLLIALSEETSLTSCSELFMSFGWDIESTPDPSMAVRLATFRKYDAVVADLQFAHWQCRAGLPIIEAAKRRDRRSVAVLLGTSHTDRAEREARDAGADVLLLKPVALHAIAHSIRTRWAQSDPHAAAQQ